MSKLIPVHALQIGNVFKAFPITMHSVLQPYYTRYKTRQNNKLCELYPNFGDYDMRLDNFNVWTKYYTKELLFKSNIANLVRLTDFKTGIKDGVIMELITDNEYKKMTGAEVTNLLFDNLFKHYEQYDGTNKYYKVTTRAVDESFQCGHYVFTCEEYNEDNKKLTPIQLYANRQNLVTHYITNELIYKGGYTMINECRKDITNVELVNV